MVGARLCAVLGFKSNDSDIARACFEILMVRVTPVLDEATKIATEDPTVRSGC